MGWGSWNKIKKGFAKVKSKVMPAIKKGAKFISENRDLINAGLDAAGSKLGFDSSYAKGLVDTVGRFSGNYGNPPDDIDYDESGGMITPMYK